MNTEAVMKGCGLPNNIRTRGTVPDEMMDPSDMKSHIATSKTKRMSAHRQDSGDIAK
jgi:hypothetical protein